MPQWGRPPGARLGRPTRGREVAAAAAQRMWDDSRIAEIDNAVMEEEEDGDEYMRQARQLATVGRNNRNGGWEWRDPVCDNYNNNYYDYYADETGSVDGVEYDLYDDTDSTVAYAIELAMKDKEEWLVDRALERIRRAQVSGQNNVRISKRELEALERKRGHQTSEFNGSSPRGTSTRRAWQVMDSPIKGMNGHTRPRRSGSGASQNQALLPSPQRPRTPTMQPLQPQSTNASPRSPVKPPYPSQPFPCRGSNDRRISNNPFSQVISLRPGSDNENHDHKAKERDDSGDQVQIVDVVKRRVPISPSPRRSRGSRR